MQFEGTCGFSANRGEDAFHSSEREHVEFAKTRYDRANGINDRAEWIQAKSDALMARSGKVFKLVIPILVALVAAAGWLLFRIM